MEDFKPLDLGKLKEITRQESAKLNVHSVAGGAETSFTLALALSAAIKKIFYEKSQTTFSDEPRLEKKPITQFVHRMRVDAMEKFNATTVFSVIHFAASEEEMQRQGYMLTLVAYLEQKFLPEFMRLLQYPYIDSDDEAQVKDGCGTLVNLIAGQFKREMSHLGYRDLMMSTFESYINTAPDGVAIPKGVTDKFELSFEVEGSKRLVIEMATWDLLAKLKPQEKTSVPKILLVGDDKTLIPTLASYLNSQGFQVITADDGQDGVRKLKERPRLVIIDEQMPATEGQEFIMAKQQSQDFQHIPVLALAAKEATETFKVEGAREYLYKPFEPAMLLKSIQRCL